MTLIESEDCERGAGKKKGWRGVKRKLLLGVVAKYVHKMKHEMKHLLASYSIFNVT